MTEKKRPGTGGEHYIPYEERTGGESTVYFTSDLSAEGLHRIFGKVKGNLTGTVAVKLPERSTAQISFPDPGWRP